MNSFERDILRAWRGRDQVLGFCSYRQDEDWHSVSFRCLPTSEELLVPTWNSLRSQFFSQLAPSWGCVSALQAGKIRHHMAKTVHMFLSLNPQVENATLKLRTDEFGSLNERNEPHVKTYQLDFVASWPCAQYGGANLEIIVIQNIYIYICIFDKKHKFLHKNINMIIYFVV